MITTGSDPATVQATPRTTKFSLAANYDPELVPQLAGYPIDEVYGKFRNCSGRYAAMLGMNGRPSSAATIS